MFLPAFLPRMGIRPHYISFLANSQIFPDGIVGSVWIDWHFCREILYITKKGTYFIYGEGGALSRYAYVGKGFSSYGDDFQIVTESEAKEWAEHKLSADEYTKILGE